MGEDGMETVKRGWQPGDEREFGPGAQGLLLRAAQELYYLASRGYGMKQASAFIGDHYLLSQRQRMALVRVVSPCASLAARREKERAVPGAWVLRLPVGAEQGNGAQ